MVRLGRHCLRSLFAASWRFSVSASWCVSAKRFQASSDSGLGQFTSWEVNAFAFIGNFPPPARMYPGSNWGLFPLARPCLPCLGLLACSLLLCLWAAAFRLPPLFAPVPGRHLSRATCRAATHSALPGSVVDETGGRAQAKRPRPRYGNDRVLAAIPRRALMVAGRNFGPVRNDRNTA